MYSNLNTDQAYFLIDSEHLTDVTNSLHGYCICETGLYTSFDQLTQALHYSDGAKSEQSAPWLADLLHDAGGAWVLVERHENAIRISQDHMGSYGLFLFSEGDFWALSNNFAYLVDHLKTRYKLTLDSNYFAALLFSAVASYAYGRTPIHEIEWLDRREKLFIDVPAKSIQRIINKGQRRAYIDSAEGIAKLDSWHDRWVSRIRSAHRSWPGTIKLHLSGGYDSRMVLSLFLSAGIPLSDISVYSDTTLKDDFAIASQIVSDHDAKLNDKAIYLDVSPEPTAELLELRLSTLGFNRICYSYSPLAQPCLSFGGQGGESLRNFDSYGREDLVQKWVLNNARLIFQSEAGELVEGATNVLDESIACSECFEQDQEQRTSVGAQLWLEAQARIHFGMAGLSQEFLQNYYEAAPLMDADLLCIQLDQSDLDLLPALIFTRYASELLKYPFENVHEVVISEETLDRARELNKRFPYVAPQSTQEDSFEWRPVEMQNVSLQQLRCLPPNNILAETALRAFLSPKVKEAICAVWGESVYNALRESPSRRNSQPYIYWMTALGLAKTYWDTQHARLSDTAGGESFNPSNHASANFLLELAADVSSSELEQEKRKIDRARWQRKVATRLRKQAGRVLPNRMKRWIKAHVLSRAKSA